MDQEKIEKLKKLAKPIQDFMASNMASNSELVDSLKIEGNSITIEYSGSLQIFTHYHTTDVR